MSELQVLYLVLVAVYLLQCLVWVPQECVAFRKSWRGHWRVVSSGLHIGAWEIRGLLANPLPPLEGILACDVFPIALSPEAIQPMAPAARSGRTHDSAPERFLFSELEKISHHGKAIRAGRRVLLHTHSPVTARSLSEFLETLRTAKPHRRIALIEAEIVRGLDSASASARLQEGEKATRILTVLCNLLFAFLFLLTPAIVTLLGLRLTWPWLLGILLLSVLAIGVAFFRAHRSLFPEQSDTRFVSLVTVLLSPPAAIRANDLLFKELLYTFHPVALARILCPEKEAMELAARALREAHFPLPGGTMSSDEMWFGTLWQQALQRFVVHGGGDPNKSLGAPARESEACRAYCPRCWNQYVVTEGICADCSGFPLQNFPEE